MAPRRKTRIYSPTIAVEMPADVKISQTTEVNKKDQTVRITAIIHFPTKE